MAKEDIKRYSLDDLESRRAAHGPGPRAKAVPQPVDPEFWTTARIVMPPGNKASIHLRIDADVLNWFRAQGQGHLSRMNAVLRSFMEAKKE